MIERQMNNTFDLVSKYEPSGDQPEAIKQIVNNLLTNAIKYTEKGNIKYTK